MARDPKTGRFKQDVSAEREGEREKDSVAASFQYCGVVGTPRSVSGQGGRMSLVDEQKFRNNYLRLSLQAQMSACRRVSKYNGLVRPVIRLRRASFASGFQLKTGIKSEPVLTPFTEMVRSGIHESLVSSNVVALWRKGEPNPPITILNTETCDYTAVGGVEKLTLRIPQNRRISEERDEAIKAAYRKNLGEKLYQAYRTGGNVTIASGFDPEWDFRVMTEGKWEGGFEVPELLGMLDTIDYLAMMEVGDWNAANFRKDVIRTIKKGWRPAGQNAVGNSVDMSETDMKTLGAGFSALKGGSNIPMNHDVDLGYLLMPADVFDPKQVKSAIDRFLVWAGIEAVVLLGSFSQQNGAAPSLMRNHRTEALDLRGRMEAFCLSILEADEFKGLVKKPSFDWSVKSLYSMEEITSMVTATADGIASPQTRRGWLDLDDETETKLMRAAHKNKLDYTPVFEARQGLLGEKDAKTGGGGKPGRPGSPDDV